PPHREPVCEPAPITVNPSVPNTSPPPPDYACAARRRAAGCRLCLSRIRHSRTMPFAIRLLVKTAASVLVLYLILLAGLLLVMRSPTPFGKVMRHMPGPAFAILPFRRLWFIARAGRLQPGDVAPDFDLLTSDTKSH